MEWLVEAVEQETTLTADAVEVKEPEPTDRLDALVEAMTRTDLAPTKAATLRAILKNVRDSIDNAIKLLDDAPHATMPMSEGLVQEEVQTWNVDAIPRASERASSDAHQNANDRVVEGVFDGQGMIGDDGKSYIVPPNYASKSKLVEGDMLKLTIGERGNFIFKQIGPIERQRLIGSLAYEQETGQFLVVAGGRSWKVLKASITYFKAEAGDEAVILVPKNAPSKWAAAENIIRKKTA